MAFIPGQSPPDVKIPILMALMIGFIVWIYAVKITKNYLLRVKKKEKIEPMYNFDPEIQAEEMARDNGEDEE